MQEKKKEKLQKTLICIFCLMRRNSSEHECKTLYMYIKKKEKGWGIHSEAYKAILKIERVF